VTGVSCPQQKRCEQSAIACRSDRKEALGPGCGRGCQVCVVAAADHQPGCGRAGAAHRAAACPDAGAVAVPVTGSVFTDASSPPPPAVACCWAEPRPEGGSHPRADLRLRADQVLARRSVPSRPRPAGPQRPPRRSAHPSAAPRRRPGQAPRPRQLRQTGGWVCGPPPARSAAVRSPAPASHAPRTTRRWVP